MLLECEVYSKGYSCIATVRLNMTRSRACVDTKFLHTSRNRCVARSETTELQQRSAKLYFPFLLLLLTVEFSKSLHGVNVVTAILCNPPDVHCLVVHKASLRVLYP